MAGKQYKNYVFDLYGTLVDIHTDEEEKQVWEKLALFYGYYGALYTPEELQQAYSTLVKNKENVKKSELEAEPRYAHEAFPEIQIENVFQELFRQKGVEADMDLSIHAVSFLGCFLRNMSVFMKGFQRCLRQSVKWEVRYIFCRMHKEFLQHMR